MKEKEHCVLSVLAAFACTAETMKNIRSRSAIYAAKFSHEVVMKLSNVTHSQSNESHLAHYLPCLLRDNYKKKHVAKCTFFLSYQTIKSSTCLAVWTVNIYTALA